MKAAWDKVVDVYEWTADIVADYPRTVLAVMLALVVMALL